MLDKSKDLNKIVSCIYKPHFFFICKHYLGTKQNIVFICVTPGITWNIPGSRLIID